MGKSTGRQRHHLPQLCPFAEEDSRAQGGEFDLPEATPSWEGFLEEAVGHLRLCLCTPIPVIASLIEVRKSSGPSVLPGLQRT